MASRVRTATGWRNISLADTKATHLTVEIYYLDLESVLCSVKVEPGEQVVPDLPRPLFPTRVAAARASSRDGAR